MVVSVPSTHGAHRDDAEFSASMWHLTGDGPDEGRHFPGDRDHDLVGMFPPCREVSETFAQPHLGFPADVLDGLWVAVPGAIGDGG